VSLNSNVALRGGQRAVPLLSHNHFWIVVTSACTAGILAMECCCTRVESKQELVNDPEASPAPIADSSAIAGLPAWTHESRQALVVIVAGDRPASVTGRADGVAVSVDVRSKPQGASGKRSVGAGIFVSNDGYLLTTSHAVGKAPLFACFVDTRGSPRCTEVRVVSRGDAASFESDIALLKVEATPAGWLQLATVDDIERDATCIAVGSGLISSRFKWGRIDDLRAVRPDAAHRSVAMFCISHTCQIGAGDSGGPLVVSPGRLAGINVQAVVSVGPPAKRFSRAILPDATSLYRLLEEDRRSCQ
jgi:S1-C subfamily serine protease